MSVTISFPLTDKQASTIVIAADAFGVEPWEMAAHVLRIRDELNADRRRREDRP